MKTPFWLLVGLAACKSQMGGIDDSGHNIVDASIGLTDGIGGNSDGPGGGGACTPASVVPSTSVHAYSDPSLTYTLTSDGWTDLDALLTTNSAKIQVVYVSNAGADINDGSATDKAVLSIGRAKALVTSISSGGKIPWVKFRRGDTFISSATNQFGNPPSGMLVSGHIVPIVFTSYGTVGTDATSGRENRPIIKGAELITTLGSASVSNLIIAGLEIVGTAGTDAGVGGAAGINISSAASNILIEDCYIANWNNNITLNGRRSTVSGVHGDQFGAPNVTIQNISVRRTILVDATNSGGTFNGQGIFADLVDGLYIDENVFDHNGWSSDATRSPYSHSLYLDNIRNLNIRRNIITRACINAELRSGGDTINNYFGFTATALDYWRPFGKVLNNVITEGVDTITVKTDPTYATGYVARGLNADLNNYQTVSVDGGYTQPGDTFTITGNLIASDVSTSAPNDMLPPPRMNHRAMIFSIDHGVTLTNNVVYKWTDPEQGQTAVYIYPQPSATTFPGVSIDPAGFPLHPLVTGDTYLGAYFAGLTCLPESIDDFIAVARTQSRNHWDDNFTARAINRHLRAEFGISEPTDPNGL